MWLIALRRCQPFVLKAIVLEITQTIRRNAGQIQAAGVGQNHALYGYLNGTIVMTDDLGMAVLRAIQKDSDKDLVAKAILDFSHEGFKPSHDEAAQIGRAIVEDWHHAGLFDGQPRPFPRPAGPTGDITPWQLNYASGHGAFLVDTDDAHLAKELDVILSAFRTSSRKASPSDVFRCTTNSDGDSEVFYGGAPIWSSTDRDEARFLLLKEAAQSLSGHPRVGAVLHGAAVRAPNGGVLIFTGESGAGKSTLSLGLVAQGWRLLADDHIPISKEGHSLIAFPTATAVKPGSMHLEETRALRETYAMLESEREGVSYLTLPYAADGGTQLPVTAIVLPQYGADLDFKLEPMSREDAFFACVASGARPCRHDPQIGSLAALCNDVPTYKLDFQTSAQSLGACQSLVDQ